MTLLTERFPTHPEPVSVEGVVCGAERAAALDLPRRLDRTVEFMRWCDVCEALEQFTAAWQCEAGLLGCCRGCGDERIAPWTRTTEACA